jgi:dTDP-4-dehydrorhamnose reductase
VIELEKRGHRSIGSDITSSPVIPSITDRAAGGETPDPSYVHLDITDHNAVRRTIEELKPDVIIHCAAWTAVDAAEAPENREKFTQ